MKLAIRFVWTVTLMAAVTTWLSGCGQDSGSPTATETTPTAEEHEHEEGAHSEEGGHEEGHEHAEGHAHGMSHEEMEARVQKLASYDEAMHEIGELREQVEHLIESGRLGDVHPPAQLISEIARRLPDLASKSGIPRSHWRDINTQSRDLANMFDEIDDAADAGKKAETEAAFAKMVKLIDGLKTFAPHDHEHD